MKKGRREEAGGRLRHRAEKRLREGTPRRAAGEAEDPHRLLHELEVHQIELEIQNEELRAARAAAEEALKRYSELFEFAPIGYFAIGADGIVREANLAGARLLGTERQRLVGRRFAVFVAEGERRAFGALLARVLTQGGDSSSETAEIVLGGEERDPVDALLTAVCLEGSAPMALVAVEDVSRRKKAEEALRQEGRNKDAFLATLSHELRNPLTPIRNALSVLERSEPTGERASDVRAVISRQVGHLSRIVDDLLDVTRIARGKVRLREERLELVELVRGVLEDHLATFEQSGVRLSSKLPPEPIWIDADATRIAQVVGNLLANAAKFTSRGGTVDVILRRDGRSAELTVRDNGVGISPEVQAHLFEPFRQAPQTLDRSHGGLGLGLAMVRGFVEMHGGTAAVRSEGLGRGSEFRIALPLGRGPDDPRRAIPEERPRSSRVLVIEDNVDAATTLKEVLETEGHEVEVAFDGPGGLLSARSFRPEVVLCDIGLPGMSGYEVARALRSDEALRDVYLVALSGYALPEDVRRAVDAGFDRHVAKPPSLDDLERLLAGAH